MSGMASDLYQTIILEHNRAPRSYGEVANPTHRGEGYNPICGDRVLVTARVADGVLTDVMFTAQCCALCRASASVLMETVVNHPLGEVAEVLIRFEEMIRGKSADVIGPPAAFAAVKDFPARAKCVVLAWRTLGSALKNQSSVTTEDEE